MIDLSNYLVPIKYGLLIFPFVAFLFTFPYVYYQYRRYKHVHWFNTLVVYSLVYYLLNAYFLVILPLPAKSQVASGGYLSSMQLIPFYPFIEFFSQGKLTIRQFLGSFDFLQLVFNVVMFIPLGLYSRYVFKLDAKKSVAVALAVSLFFELTQLSGLYGIYPGPYRTFDVDDLICNSLGGLIGYLFAIILAKVLPSMDKLNERIKSENVDSIQLVLSFLIDMVVFSIPFTLIMLLITAFFPKLVDIVTFEGFFCLFYIIYHLYFAINKQGSSIGRKFCNIKVVGKDKKAIYNRYLILTVSLVVLPIVANLFSFLKMFYDLYLMLFVFVYLFKLFFRKKDMYYEIVSKTKIESCLK
ncbi:MAG: VanZ family protein [Erysipelotrichaceae bacterium]